MIAPMVHLNGSGKKHLVEGYETTHEALVKAISALYDIAPHGRDYYPLGDDAFIQAQAEHRARIVAVEKVCAEVMELWQAVTGAP